MTNTSNNSGVKKLPYFMTTCKSQFMDLDDESRDIQCLLCEEKHLLPYNEQSFLTHLFVSHRLVIGDVEKIASLKSYIHYWRTVLKEKPLVNYCTTLLMDCTPCGKPSKNEIYYLLSDCLPEDKTLREEIHRAKLEWVLTIQEQERLDETFKRGCMFCRTEFSGSRCTYLKHLSEKHNIQLGKPENLVFIDKFLDKIEESIQNLICIYCEKKFKNRNVLKEHMRKKMHKRVNPSNQYYDKFYVINYLEIGRTWRQKEKDDHEIVHAEEDSDNDDEDEHCINFNSDEDDSEWSDWNDESIVITCLFCENSCKEFNEVLDHMIQKHNFSIENITKEMTFYEKIKVVNYIRYQIRSSRCIFCDIKCDDANHHMKNEDHYKLPNKKTWMQPEFYFPTLENDSFLYNLDLNIKELENSEIDRDKFTELLNISTPDE